MFIEYRRKMQESSWHIFRKEASLSTADAQLEVISALTIGKEMYSGGAVAFETNKSTKQMPSRTTMRRQ
jgi:hypothetical protein